MDQIVSNVDNIIFDIEIALQEQHGAKSLPFPGMDKSGAPVCDFYVRSTCSRGTACPFRHVRGDKTIVCKHWLRGLCKKGDQCEFLHEYDMSKMPECYFYSRFNACHNKECPFLHVDPESRIKECPWYDRGFCRHGPLCRHRHVRRLLCINYLAGFCPKGNDCTDSHPRFELPVGEAAEKIFRMSEKSAHQQPCQICSEVGHKSYNCPKGSVEEREKFATPNSTPLVPTNIPSATHSRLNGTSLQDNNVRKQYRNIEDVVCFKCGEKGHYANKCHHGHLAFLSHRLADTALQQHIQSVQQQSQHNFQNSNNNNHHHHHSHPPPQIQQKPMLQT